MKKTLALAAIASVIATNAFAVSLGSAGFGVIHSDVRTQDGAKVGIVTKVLSNSSIEATVNGETKVLNRGDFLIREGAGQTDFDVTLSN